MALVLCARAFFAPVNYQRNCQIIGKTPASRAIHPLSGQDFMEYLKATPLLEDPDRYIYQVRHLLERMAANNILVEVPGAGTSYVMIPKSYYALSEVSAIRSAGMLWMAKTLGGRFIHHQISPAIVQITGEASNGHPKGGSGVILDAHHILTCRHVLTGMKVHGTQSFQGRQVTIDEDFVGHKDLDVAVLRVEDPLRAVPGLAFLAPFVTQKVYTFGYPRVPCALPEKSGNSPLIVQGGEVTGTISVFGRTELFLYSAVARGGNSGGAIVSDDGYVVGIATDVIEGRYSDEQASASHYAGIPADVIAQAINDLALGIQLPYETFD